MHVLPGSPRYSNSVVGITSKGLVVGSQNLQNVQWGAMGWDPRTGCTVDLVGPGNTSATAVSDSGLVIGQVDNGAQYVDLLWSRHQVPAPDVTDRELGLVALQSS